MQGVYLANHSLPVVTQARGRRKQGKGCSNVLFLDSTSSVSHKGPCIDQRSYSLHMRSMGHTTPETISQAKHTPLLATTDELVGCHCHGAQTSKNSESIRAACTRASHMDRTVGDTDLKESRANIHGLF